MRPNGRLGPLRSYFADAWRFGVPLRPAGSDSAVATPDQPVPVLEGGRNARDLEPAALPFDDAAPEQGEGFPEEGADEMRLEPARLGTLHLLPDRGDRVRVHALRGELAFGDEALD